MHTEELTTKCHLSAYLYVLFRVWAALKIGGQARGRRGGVGAHTFTFLLLQTFQYDSSMGCCAGGGGKYRADQRKCVTDCEEGESDRLPGPSFQRSQDQGG